MLCPDKVDRTARTIQPEPWWTVSKRYDDAAVNRLSEIKYCLECKINKLPAGFGKHHCIACMQECKSRSLEDLRVEDYGEYKRRLLRATSVPNLVNCESDEEEEPELTRFENSNSPFSGSFCSTPEDQVPRPTRPLGFYMRSTTPPFICDYKNLISTAGIKIGINNLFQRKAPAVVRRKHLTLREKSLIVVQQLVNCISLCMLIFICLLYFYIIDAVLCFDTEIL